LNDATAYYLLSDGTYTTTEPQDTATLTTSPTPVKENVKYNAQHNPDLSGQYYKKSGEDAYVAIDQATDTDTYEQDYVVYLKKTETVVDTTTQNVSQVVEVGSDGILNLNGLKAGEYTITEIEAPVGYNALETPIAVKIEWQEPASGKIGTEGCTWTFKVDMNGGTNYETKTAETDGTYKLTVVNQAGSTLPHTGGIGTTIFYVIGSILVLGAVILLITMSRVRRDSRN
jgi:LPXTG-motif cell wall-anchored protein